MKPEISSLDEFKQGLSSLLEGKARPVVVYSGLFALRNALGIPNQELPQTVFDILVKEIGENRTLLMPAYTRGFQNGVIDLDAEPGNTGMVNELLRQAPGTKRTASAFFSFVARGPEATSLARLRPVDAWGKGSVFEWIEAHDATIIMLGVPWCMCSFLHRAEWFQNVPYRYLKSFSGVMVRDGKPEALNERLFVRSLDPLADNIWPGLEGYLEEAGMKAYKVGQSQLAAIGARALIKAVAGQLQKNPFSFVKNPELLRGHFSKVHDNADFLAG